MKAGSVRSVTASFAGPVLAFGIMLGRRLVPDPDGTLVVSLLFAAVTAGAVLGGRWSALAPASLGALGLVLAATDAATIGTGVSVGIMFGIAIVAGELRNRVERAERGVDSANARLKRLALRDALTGLLDRRGFEVALSAELARATRRNGRCSLVVLELTGLRLANERLGRSIGDTLLQVFADAVERRIRQSDIAARVGDDEFGVILPDTDGAGAELVARQIIASFLVDIGGIVPADLALGSSFGIAQFPADARKSDDLLTIAGRQAGEHSAEGPPG